MIAMTRKNDRPADDTLSAEENTILADAYRILLKRVRTGSKINGPGDLGELLRLRIATHERETFTVVFLDCRHRVIAIEDMFRGTLTGADVCPREIARAALRHNAAALAVAHNHPSGDPEPSAADRAFTARLSQALSLLEIRLLDHFVVTVGEAPVSLAARGWV